MPNTVCLSQLACLPAELFTYSHQLDSHPLTAYTPASGVCEPGGLGRGQCSARECCKNYIRLCLCTEPVCLSVSVCLSVRRAWAPAFHPIHLSPSNPLPTWRPRATTPASSPLTRFRCAAQSPKSVGYSWSYLAFRIGTLIPIQCDATPWLPLHHPLRTCDRMCSTMLVCWYHSTRSGSRSLCTELLHSSLSAFALTLMPQPRVCRSACLSGVAVQLLQEHRYRRLLQLGQNSVG
jgi:hypothetical protein